jgi:hypothetical protein
MSLVVKLFPPVNVRLPLPVISTYLQREGEREKKWVGERI